MRLIVVGTEGSKRTQYMKKAADSLGVALEVMDWQSLEHGWKDGQLEGAVVKLDPPSYQTVHLYPMRQQLEQYRQKLELLEQYQQTPGQLSEEGCHFLNTPSGIWQLLDKRGSKERLLQKGGSVTRMLSGRFDCEEQLLDRMQEEHCYSVFLKPALFSGAAGVTALRIHPSRGRMAAYTSCRLEKGELVNTKQLFHLEDRGEIVPLLHKLLELDCVVEQWHPKEVFQGKSYDLRLVYQFGHIAWGVVRQSKGPITNLHLNNQARELSCLGLGRDVMEELEQLCGQAVSAFDGISMAGIDVLLERGTGKPRIIEMNGQGDLIYQDIYGENRIYREQVRRLCGK